MPSIVLACRRATRQLLLALCALLAVTQGVSTWLRAAGLAHQHVEAASTAHPVDPRRDPVAASYLHVGDAQLAARWLAYREHGADHARAHEAGLRHHHDDADPGLRWADAERAVAEAVADDDRPAGDAGGFLPLAVTPARWQGVGDAAERPAGALWVPTAAFPARLERPPQARHA